MRMALMVGASPYRGTNMFNWLSNFIGNALSSESTAHETSAPDLSSFSSDHCGGFERFDNFGCGAPFQASAEASYLAETRSHEFTTTTYGDSLSTDWTSSSFGSSWD